MDLKIQKFELILLFITFLVILSVYVSTSFHSFLSIDGPAYILSIINKTPGWMDGKPVYIWIGRFFLWLGNILGYSGPELIYVFDFYSAVFGALTCVNIYFIYRKLFDRRYEGIVASILLAFSPIFLLTSSMVEVYTPNLFFVTLSILFWLERNFVLFGISWGLAISSHASSILLVVPFLVSLPSKRDMKNNLFVGLIITVVILLLGYFWVISFYNDTYTYANFYLDVTKKEYIQPFDLNTILSGLIMFINGIGVDLFIITILAIPLLIRSVYRDKIIFLTSWFIPYFLFFTFWIKEMFYVYTIPPIAILSARSIFYISKFFNISETNITSKNKLTQILPKLQNLLILLFLIILVFLRSTYYYQMIYNSHDMIYDFDKFSIWTVDNVPQGSIIITSLEGLSVRFYNSKITVLLWGDSTFPEDESEIRSLVYTNITNYLKNGKKVYVTEYWFKQEGMYKGDDRFIKASFFLKNEFNVTKINDYVYKVTAK